MSRFYREAGWLLATLTRYAMPLTVVGLSLAQAACHGRSVSVFPNEALPTQAVLRSISQTVTEFGYTFSPRSSETPAIVSEAGPCDLGEFGGRYFPGTLTDISTGRSRSGWVVLGEPCEGHLFELSISNKLDTLPPEWMNLIRDNAISQTLVPLKEQSCGKHSPRYLDELPRSALDHWMKQPELSLYGSPRPEVEQSLVNHRRTIESLLVGRWAWTRARQVIDGGDGTLLPGTFVLRGAVGPVRATGASIAVDPVHGNVVELVIWQGCEQGVELYP